MLINITLEYLNIIEFLNPDFNCTCFEKNRCIYIYKNKILLEDSFHLFQQVSKELAYLSIPIVMLQLFQSLLPEYCCKLKN